MKKILLCTLVLVFAAVSANAQGRWFVSGSINAAYEKTKGVDATTAIEFTPSINYMFNDNWAVGLGLKYGYMEANKISNNLLGIAPTLTYFGKMADKFYYTPGLSIFYERLIDAKVNTFGALVTPLSFEFRPTNCLGLVFTAGGLGFESSKQKGGNSVNSLGLALNTDLGFGFRFYF